MNNLLKAIDLATVQCSYVWDGKPGCVIAHLNILEGGTVDEMRGWGRASIEKICPPRLQHYRTRLLYELQAIWDLSYADVEGAKKKMRELVLDEEDLL